MQKTVLNLWYNTQAEEAARLYTSLLPNSQILKTTRYTAASSKVSGMPEGSVLTVEFTLDGQEYVALNGGPIFQFTPAVSILVRCVSQQEVDRLWNSLCEGGQPSQCGWLTDRYGLSWQIVPTELERLLADENPQRVEAVLKAMYTMGKLEIEELLAAYHSI